MSLKNILSVAALCLMTQVSVAQVTVNTDPKDFGLWAGVDLDFSLGKKFDLGVGADLRTADGFNSLSRWSAGLSVDFKPTKILSFGAGYTFIDSHYEPSYTSKGNIVDEYWRIKNRFYFGAKVKGKFGVVRPSLRLRYQGTNEAEVSIKKYASDGTTRKSNKTKASEYESFLRTKAQVDFKTKSCFEPFVSFELWNDAGNKTRLSAGTDIKLNKHNAISVGYVRNFFSGETDDDNNNHNALSIGYKIKL